MLHREMDIKKKLKIKRKEKEPYYSIIQNMQSVKKIFLDLYRKHN